MFTFFFKYPWAAYQKGRLVFESGWPWWLLLVLAAAGAAFAGLALWRHRRDGMALGRAAVLWLLQTLSMILLLTLLWQPALSLSTLKPQQNVVAVVVDDSRSMALADTGRSRSEQAKTMLDGGLLEGLKKKFQVRVYRMAGHLERLDPKTSLEAKSPSTRIGDALHEAIGEAATLPVGAVVLLSDGADNSGGIDLQTTTELRRSRIPIHTVGFGRERMERDVEIVDAQLPARTLPGARVSAAITYRQSGFNGAKARLQISDGMKVVASREISMKGDAGSVTENLVFQTGTAGAQSYRVALTVLEGEQNPRNNELTRVVNVEDRKPRILYFEGEPRWEYKFIRRASEEDKAVSLASIVRTTQNKIYVQGRNSPNELAQGFPAEVDELFAFQGIILGSVEAASFTPSQIDLLKAFVDRRGGGLLFLGGRNGLSEGAWQRSPLAELIPVSLPDRKGTFHRDPASVLLTGAGRDSLLTRLDENPDRNAAKWQGLPQLADYQETGEPKPGAVTLLEMAPTSRGRFPLLTVENYGRGHTAVLATGGTWRWRMRLDSKDKTHETIWQQFLRWLVADVPERVVSSMPKSVFADETSIPLRVEVRDRNYLPAADAKVEAKINGPGGIADHVELHPDPVTAGVYTAAWTANAPGSYGVEVTARQGENEIGRDVVTFRREDGVAEDFRTEQNRELLEKIASETGGRYFTPSQTNDLLDAVSLSEAGISVKENRQIWDMPAALILFALLRGGEWLLRRRWGAV